MGTNFVRLAKLTKLNQLTKDENLYGFYLTKEGRDFLRELLPALIARTQFGEGKIASIIADGNASRPRKEVDGTKAALRRWKGGQAELWLDQRKNERHLQRLEALFMSVDECREVLEDQARTVTRDSVGSAIARFFYGENSLIKHRELLSKSDSMPMARIFQKLEILFTEKKITISDKTIYFAYFPVENKPFLLCQEVAVKNGFKWVPGNGIVSHFSGFGYLSDQNTIHRFMSAKHTGVDRIHDVLSAYPPSGFKAFVNMERENGSQDVILYNKDNLYSLVQEQSFSKLGKHANYVIYQKVHDGSNEIHDFLLRQAWDVLI